MKASSLKRWLTERLDLGRLGLAPTDRSFGVLEQTDSAQTSIIAQPCTAEAVQGWAMMDPRNRLC